MQHAEVLDSSVAETAEEYTFPWRHGVVIRLAARIHARILTIVYLLWVCHRLFAPSPRDPYTLWFALVLVLTYLLSLALFSLLCSLAPRQQVTVTRQGIVNRTGRRESRLAWPALEKIEHSVDADGQLVIMSLFSDGRRKLVFTEGYPLNDLASRVHAAAGYSVPVTIVHPMLDLRYLSRHWPLAALTFAVVVALSLEWLPRWLG